MRIYDLDSFRDAIKIGVQSFWRKFIHAYFAEKRPDLVVNDDDLEIDFSNDIFDFKYTF